jgi:hypothetical protein
MSVNGKNVQKLDIHPLDLLRSGMMKGLKRLSVRQRCVRFNFWRGLLEASETVTTAEEPNDCRL